MIVDQKLNKGFAGIYLIDGDIDGTQLATTVKPNRFRRVMTRLFVGWKWISIKDLKELQKKVVEKENQRKSEELLEKQETIRLGKEVK